LQHSANRGTQKNFDAFKLKLFRSAGQDNHRISDCADLTFESLAVPRLSQWVNAFVKRLAELGWIEGRTVTIEYRWAETRAERYTEIAAEFVKLKVDVIVTWASALVLAEAS
jgi:hypothetical protein